jgi:hypothetical protein
MHLFKQITTYFSKTEEGGTVKEATQPQMPFFNSFEIIVSEILEEPPS